MPITESKMREIRSLSSRAYTSFSHCATAFFLAYARRERGYVTWQLLSPRACYIPWIVGAIRGWRWDAIDRTPPLSCLWMRRHAQWFNALCTCAFNLFKSLSEPVRLTPSNDEPKATPWRLSSTSPRNRMIDVIDEIYEIEMTQCI